MIINLLRLIVLLTFTVFSIISCNTTSSETELVIDYGSVTDVEGNTYKTVVIGNQEWMAEDLVTSHYRDGSKIMYDDLYQASEFLELGFNGIGAWTYYIDNGYIVYNVLYNWYAINDNRGLCPTGWKIPTKNEWDTLLRYLGENSGGKMKETEGWKAPNSGANNSSGFTALPTGLVIKSDGSGYYNSGSVGYWWTSTGNNQENDNVFIKQIWYNSTKLTENVFDKNNGVSVRCLKRN